MDSVKNTAKEKMGKAVDSLEKDFGKLRTGRASTSLVEDIKVEHYGTVMPLGQMSTISTPDSRTITIQPWDRGSFGVIEKTILKSNLGITPVNDGKIIRIGIPPLTEERRKDLVKVARKYCEEAKVAVRNIRREANEALKKLEKDKDKNKDKKAYSEDDIKRAQEEIQKLTDNFVATLDQKTLTKEKEIMEI